MVTAFEASAGDYCHLYEFQFSGGTERYTDAPVDISWGPPSPWTWTALGGHIGYEAIQETAKARSQGVRVTLDGVATTVITHVLGENFIGRTAIIRLAQFSSGTVVADPLTIFDGYMSGDVLINETIGDDSTCRIVTTLTPKMPQFSQVRGIKANLTSHQEHYSGDTFFSHITAVANLKQLWGGYIKTAPVDYPWWPDADGRGGDF
jgi:hypothetical protein